MQHNEHENGFLNFLIAPLMSTMKQIITASNKRSINIFSLKLIRDFRELIGILGYHEVFWIFNILTYLDQGTKRIPKDYFSVISP